MTNDEIRSMLERQLVRLEGMSEKTTHSRALTGMTGSMLAVSRRLEQMHARDNAARKIDSDLAKTRQSAIELAKITGNRVGKDDPLYQQAKRISDSIDSISILFLALQGYLCGNGGKDA